MIKRNAHRIAFFGATSDIATAVARRYAEKGARLVLVGRNEGALERTRADLEVRGASDVAVRQADLSCVSALQAASDAAWNVYGGLDLALIGYGSLPDQLAVEQSAEATFEALTLNFASPAALLNELAAKFEAERKGTIAVISSVAGDRGRKSNYVYGAAKGGLQRFLEGLRHRLSRSGVSVLDIRPGFVATKMTAHLSQGGALWGNPDAVAGDIIKAIERDRAVLYTPWFWRPIMMVVRLLPRFVMHRTSL